MPYLVLTFVHVGSMFLATAFAVGPILVLVLVLRTGDAQTVHRAFSFAEPIARAGGILYGLGILFGVFTALNGGIDLTSGWLVTAYPLVGLLAANGLYAERWMGQVERAAERSVVDVDSAALETWRRSRTPLWSLGATIAITLVIVFVMVVKPVLL
jgi:uncharacterized membrane protein